MAAWEVWLRRVPGGHGAHPSTVPERLPRVRGRCQTSRHGSPTPGQSSGAEMRWRLQVNRLQELIDQLECKVRVTWPVPQGGGPSWNPPEPDTLGALPTLCVPHRPPGWNLCMKRSLPRGLTR